MSPPPRTFPVVSCIDLTDDQRLLLGLLARGESVPDLASALEELRRWGWVLQTDELSGVRWAHTAEAKRGVLGGRGWPVDQHAVGGPHEPA